MKSIFQKKTLQTLFIALATVLALPASDSYAGELVPRQRRIIVGSGSAGTGRIVRQSTWASKRLSSARSNDRPMSLQQSNPYEARIVANEKAQRNYQLQLARYNNRLESMEQKQQIKAKRDRVRSNEKQMKLYERSKEKEKREAQRLTRERQRAANNPTRSIFGSNKSSSTQAAAETSTPAQDAATRQTLWQRLKTWLFGPTASAPKL